MSVCFSKFSLLSLRVIKDSLSERETLHVVIRPLFELLVFSQDVSFIIMSSSIMSVCSVSSLKYLNSFESKGLINVVINTH